jgi:hypothetical protein
MSARNADRGGQRELVRAEAKHWNVLLRAQRDLLIEVTK